MNLLIIFLIDHLIVCFVRKQKQKTENKKISHHNYTEPKVKYPKLFFCPTNSPKFKIIKVTQRESIKHKQWESDWNCAWGLLAEKSEVSFPLADKK